MSILNDSTPTLILDYETFSESDLKKVGAYEYSKHQSTEILCCAYRFGPYGDLEKLPTRVWSPYLEKTQQHFGPLLQALREPENILVAHNALFELLITRNVFGPRYMRSKPELQSIPLSRWHCTAALSRSTGLPGKLEMVGEALKLEHQKDLAGHRLMLRMTKPKKPTKKDPSTRVLDKPNLIRLAQYCKADVKAEVDLLKHLKPMPELERKFWLLDQEINLRGFGVDRKLVQSAMKLITKETPKFDARARKLTKGAINSVRQNAALLKFLQGDGLKIKNLQAQTISELLKRNKFPSERAKELLQIRQNASRSSTKKYQAFEMRSRSDGRARDNTIFFGAHTGRQSGTGLQPQNLFKSLFSQEDLGVGLDMIRYMDRDGIEALFDKPMDLYASALRSCIVPAPGHVLDVGDFATVEVRVLFWLAGHAKGLAALESGRDLYVEMAEYIFGTKNLEYLQKKYGFSPRQLGKQVVLGAGYGIGMNGEKFRDTCKKYGIEISLDLAQRAVRAYRDLHRPIPAFWENIEKAATLALENPGKGLRIGHLRWCYEKPYLTVRLPIGRKLHYYKPTLELKEAGFGSQSLYGPKPTLFFWGTNSKTKKLEKISTWGGKLTENVVQAVSRDLLYEALQRLESSTSKPVLAVHDEIVCERKQGVGDLKSFLNTMSLAPEWAKGLPIKVEGWSEKRYRK